MRSTTHNPKRVHFEKKRKWLFERLGNKCARCPQTESLQCDVIVGEGPAHHGIGLYDRMTFYVMQHRKHNVQLLCSSCHQIKTAQDRVNARERALKLITRSTVPPTIQSISADVPHAPAPEPLSQNAGESDWLFECRKVRAQLGIP